MLLPFLILLSCASVPLSCAASRRILHQPLSTPPSLSPPPPPPPTPKYPFSTTSPTSTTQTPFFPTFPSPPPLSLSSPSLSFPANISSLSLPHPPSSQKPSSSLIALAASLAAASALITAFTILLYLRRRRHLSLSSKPLSPPKLTHPAPTSSEFLYLGTIVGPTARRSSPELRPLPPLRHQRLGSSENEEFYSPNGSSIGSAPIPPPVVGFREGERKGGSRSTSSMYSSSDSDSPTGSVSLSISPRAGSSPAVKSPELSAVFTQQPPTRLADTIRSVSLSLSSSPERDSDNSSPNFSIKFRTNNNNISLDQFKSPSISPMSSSPEQPLLKSDGSDRIEKTLELAARVVAPPPPPLPPAGHWETRVSGLSARGPITRPPPPLATPPPVNSPPSLISPTELNLENDETPKPKLKPLHWDKVRASSDREMVWDQLRSSSFRLNEEMIETLFVVNTPNSSSKDPVKRQILPSPNQENRVLDPKKAQNIAISLRALNVTIEEVCDALTEGNADALGAELLESLLKMAPTKEEERKLKEFKDDSPFKLGPAEKFLKALLDIPFAFRRLDVMLYIANFESEVEYLKKSFDTLEAACEELRNSRMFLKLLEAVLKTGNRMNVGTNRGDAHAFKLDTLLKLVDVKGADGKTTLLHFVVQEIIRTEGARLSGGTHNDDARCRKLGLEVVSSISSELANVKKAAAMDSDVLSGDVAKLSKGIKNIGEVVQLCELMGSMSNFVKVAEEEIIRVQAQESVALSLVKEITEYFHGNSAKEEAHPFRIFMVVRDFITVLDRVCKEAGMVNDRTIVSSAHKFPVPVNPMMQPPISGFSRRMEYNLSDDDKC